MNRSFFRLPKRLHKNESGMAALMGVVLALAILGALALNFMAETQQKQSGSALTYTSTNAVQIAEAGIRYTEKCLLANDPGCPPTTGNADWTTLVDFNKNFGNGRGRFEVQFVNKQINSVRIRCTGVYQGASRVLSKNVTTGTCKLAENAITACTEIKFKDNATLNPPGAPTETGYCSQPPIPPLTFPQDPAGCPNANFPDFNAGVHLDGSGFLIQFQFCKMDVKNNTVVRTSAGDVVWVAKDFKFSDNAQLLINGNTTINVGQKAEFKKNSQAQVNGTLTIQTDGDFKTKDSAVVNVVSGDPADVLALVGGKATIQDDSIFIGGIIANGKIKLEDDAQLTGSVFSIQDKVEMKNDSVLNFDPTAGSNTTGIGFCGGGGAVITPDWSEG